MPETGNAELKWEKLHDKNFRKTRGFGDVQMQKGENGMKQNAGTAEQKTD